jgi:predicted nuclease of restriction endonuclease-like (RecB) superfamily
MKRLPVRAPLPEPALDAIVSLIQAARQRAYQSVNTVLIDLHWQIREHTSRKIAAVEWGDGVVSLLAAHIARSQPGLRGFTRPNLFHMRRFYEAYAPALEGQGKVSALARQLRWTHNLIIPSQSKLPEEREFYMRMAVQECWSKRDLERQLEAALFERVVPTPAIVSPVVREIHPRTLSVFTAITASAAPRSAA